MVCQIRNKAFLRCVKTQAKKYRAMLKTDREEIKKVFLEEKRIELGRFRHGDRFNSYDKVVGEIQKRWLTPESHGLAQEIIHSVSNRTNDVILECIVEALEQESAKHKRRVDVLEILLKQKTKEIESLKKAPTNNK